jgi:hypothetical protein
MLSLNGDGLPTSEFGEVNPMTFSRKTQLDTSMNKAFLPQTITDAGFHQEIHRALFKNTGSDTLLDVIAPVTLEDNRFDSPQMQKVRKHNPSGARSNNSDLRSHQPIASLFRSGLQECQAV